MFCGDGILGDEERRRKEKGKRRGVEGNESDLIGVALSGRVS